MIDSITLHVAQVRAANAASAAHFPSRTSIAKCVCHKCVAAKAEMADCPSCASGTPVPHFASVRCESGRRNHCTCDTCF